MNIGDKGTVSRGRLGSQTGEIIAHDTVNDKYIVKFENGEITPVGTKNFKAPEEASITLSDLVAALNKAQLPANDPTVAAVLDNLNEALPGVIDGVELVYSVTAEPSFQ